jgi:hypothetical protein
MNIGFAKQNQKKIISTSGALTSKILMQKQVNDAGILCVKTSKI